MTAKGQQVMMANLSAIKFSLGPIFSHFGHFCSKMSIQSSEGEAYHSDAP